MKKYGSTPGLSRFLRATGGNVALMFGLTSAMLCTGIGVAFTMADVGRAQVELQKAVDASALAAARLGEGESLFGQDKVKPKDREAAALDIFRQNAGPRYQAVKPDIQVLKQGDDLVASVTAHYDVDNFFAGFLPSDVKRVASNSRAQSTEGGQFTDIFVVVDNSASMGIGQTASERMKMLNDPDMRATGKQPCAVACHKPGSSAQDTYPYYQSKGVRMRIDAVQDALVGFLERMKAEGEKTARTRYNLRVTGDMEFPNSLLGGRDIFFDDHDAAIAAAARLQLEARDGRRTTALARSLMWHEDNVAVGGSGATENDRQVFAILMTDGVENVGPGSPGFMASSQSYPDPSDLMVKARAFLRADDPDAFAAMGDYGVWNWGTNSAAVANTSRRLQTLNPDACQPLKDKGVTLIVMNIEYGIPEFRSKSNGTTPRFDDTYPDGSRIVPPWDGDRDATVLDLKPHILPALQACASEPGLVYSVESESQMRLAFDRITEEITSRRSVRLID